MPDFNPGECYKNAYDALHDMYGEGLWNLERTMGGCCELVHGYPRLTSGPYKGELYGHAWIECKKLGLVIDGGTGVIAARNLYLEVGQVEFCSYYTLDQARKKLDKHQDYGPWDPPPPGALFMKDGEVIQGKDCDA